MWWDRYVFFLAFAGMGQAEESEWVGIPIKLDNEFSESRSIIQNLLVDGNSVIGWLLKKESPRRSLEVAVMWQARMHCFSNVTLQCSHCYFCDYWRGTRLWWCFYDERVLKRRIKLQEVIAPTLASAPSSLIFLRGVACPRRPGSSPKWA